MMAYNNNCLPDLQGAEYRTILTKLHQELKPKTYLEIGTMSGATLALSDTASIAIDPNFKISANVAGKKPVCMLYQMPSDDFFEIYDPTLLLKNKIDFAFLDGMHHCEFLLRDFMNVERHCAEKSVIALHDCIPVEIPMTDRTQNGTPAVMPHRKGWWTGDVWRTLYVLKKYRPDLRFICLDAMRTGLVLISRLNPNSHVLKDNYEGIVEQMLRLDLEQMTVASVLGQFDIVSTNDFSAPGALAEALRQ